jgi:hypothetical protein
MPQTIQRVLAGSLVGCFLFLGSVVYPRAVAHAAHHDHHNAATHATVLCSWMCAAGQVLEGATFIFTASLGPIGLVEARVPATIASPLSLTALSRAPPGHLV